MHCDLNDLTKEKIQFIVKKLKIYQQGEDNIMHQGIIGKIHTYVYAVDINDSQRVKHIWLVVKKYKEHKASRLRDYIIKRT